ncbi:bifunctional 2-polyprenyl-6-hydroxyphenol methylase/3-demethylubiquinol 3-O-methyltransferase UbiG [Nostoc ellipsosporum NOK]|uniref:bifunctional 2-polyprenyl-6-hydroxyphenol methylase/3-demethylubiquinol 3-O-methyltransferase UbiG n=1 Tax=Sphingomonas sp. IBVSS2 TaxID=1985172 RepID=UPI000A2DB6BF|nr:bifunctional 2-polyprenyl-6-hydroxyphenol methylase/3-demethylubiquinol 3-O-methyltransferase UbiG [Sphingomonas sp. IBVSS2]MDF2381913.1 bifunctional 2-polyprenyl-6-hydroxyphenol methylase/3-demethylubiquinol 3-O-methyltransferase UbiG [Nostoc ellipsosporum NOK]OSZ69846.1 bifunctional 3-demethylubiquinol 3-O-methyltransferase/2-polyprenyl-6-hydroxyphenol methylase [Sphingomonas sp. IBVSS2]
MASATKATIDPREAAHFGKLAADWWNPKGSSAMLHRLNPARLGYVRAAVDAHWGGDSTRFTPLAGKTAIDVGCGAGLLAEPLARLGATVTGIDAAPENIGAARAHAATTGLAIEYVAGGIEGLPGRTFDLVTSMEVIEHVTDPAAFVAALAGALAEGGLMILSTPNRTLVSHLAMITLAEGAGAIPPGTHDWRKFLRPEELEDLLVAAGLKVIDRTGLGFSPARGFVTGTGEALNYLVTVVRA